MLAYEDLSARIIGAAYQVHNTLGAGYLETVYRNALAVELRNSGIPVQVEAGLPVTFQGTPVGSCYADLIVAGVIVVEVKTKETILPGHVMQLRAYLRCSGRQVGLVVNFGPQKVEVKRAAWTGMGGGFQKSG